MRYAEKQSIIHILIKGNKTAFKEAYMIGQWTSQTDFKAAIRNIFKD